MTFDKTKAMRNAERFLSQGKIRSAISEYKQVVDHDPRDYVTLNMLGDLHTKNSDMRAAVGCYTSVAEHYSKQGFAAKAIAVYNKISRIEPNSVKVAEKLAELYKTKGSVKEARSHYKALAEHYQSKGRTIEALEVWKQIAVLDTTNTEVYLTIAESFLKENQQDEAADAFTEAGLRFAHVGKHADAVTAYLRAMVLVPPAAKTLAAYLAAQKALGKSADAANTLAEMHESEPHSRDVLMYLIDACLDAENLAEAERYTIKLVEVEPSNYPRFIELAKTYLSKKDVTSATRILTISSEHLLIGGQATEFSELVNEVLSLNAEQVEALRLLTRFASWQRDEESLKSALKRLAAAAKDSDSVEDERYALSQLVMIVPQETGYRDRLREINETHGFENIEPDESLFDKKFLKNGKTGSVAKSAAKNEEVVTAEFVLNGSHDGVADFEFSNGAITSAEVHELPEASGGQVIEQASIDESVENENKELSPEEKLSREVESIRFYIDNGYNDLAAKAIEELAAEFGQRAEIGELRSYLAGGESQTEMTESHAAPAAERADNLVNSGTFSLDDFKSELGLEEPGGSTDSDYETHFNTAVAYQEMGLTEQAIQEYQEAAALVSPNDGTRRFFSCANLLGHCFMELGKPNLALKWYQRTLEHCDLNEDEKQGVWYELANAFEADGNFEEAGKYFEQVYAENINFRDVGERLRTIAVTS
jgi:tetratricopeptide (TPR) repeat protein